MEWCIEGDVVLKNLDLKESALDELDLPVKVRAGHIGIKYNEEEEEKAKQEAKQKKLQQNEDAKKLEAEKDKPKEENKDSFVEKLVTQVIKNLQVQVNNVHVRFEDRFTDPKHPFAIGVTLQELSFKTTDENWNPCVVKDAVTQIFKLVKLESLALYWNSNTTMLDEIPKEEIMLNLKNVITPQHKPDYQYLIRPISSVAYLRLNTKPEATNFSIPKILLTVVFDDITVALAKLQYNDILQLLEAFERLELLGIYRKYRPSVPRKGNASTWWHFAYKSVLEETVRRRRRMWSWDHISNHRRTMKQYREVYVQKLDQKKISAETQKKLEDGERLLDVFSIMIMRQQAKVEMETVEEVMLRAYDKFNIQLQTIQVLYATANEDWRSARRMEKSNMHVLRPISIHLCLQKCMFDKDPRMAKMKISGELPLLSLGLSDYRLQQLIDLGMSIPLPEPPETDIEDILAGPNTLLSAAEPDVTSTSLKKVVMEPGGTAKKSSSLKRATSQEYVNATDMEMNFEIKKVEIALSQRINKQEVPLVRFLVERLRTTMKMRTFDMNVEAYLGGIFLQHLKLKDPDELHNQLINNKLLTATDEGPIVNIINTPAQKDPKFKLLTVSYLKANADGPEFSTTYANTEQSINVHFSALDVLLHLGALLSLVEFAQSLQPNIPQPPAKETKVAEKDEAGKEKEETVDKPKRKRKVKPKDPKIIDIQVKAVLDSFRVAMCTADKLITDVKIKGIKSTVAVQQAKTTVAAVVRDMIVYDPSPKSLYPQILSIEGSEVLKADVVAYNDGTAGEKFADMNCVDTRVAVKIGCMKITFLNKFVNDLLVYMDNFQTAKDALKEAGEQMAEKSLEQAHNIQATAARILLDIQMKAPLIVVPQSSTSSNVLCVDLGSLKLGNEFHLAKAKLADRSPAVMDKMKIELTSLKLSRGLIGNKGKIKSEVLLLDPVTLTLGIERNLSASWYKGAPETDITGSMGNVAVHQRLRGPVRTSVCDDGHHGSGLHCIFHNGFQNLKQMLSVHLACATVEHACLKKNIQRPTPGPRRPGSTIYFRFGKDTLLAEILTLADTKQELDTFELDWELTSRSEAIEESKERGDVNGYLTVHQEMTPDFPAPTPPLPVELSNTITSMTDFLQLDRRSSQELELPPITTSEIQQLKENQDRIIANQNVMMNAQRDLFDAVADIRRMLQIKLKKADEITATASAVSIPEPPMSTASLPKPPHPQERPSTPINDINDQVQSIPEVIESEPTTPDLDFGDIPLPSDAPDTPVQTVISSPHVESPMEVFAVEVPNMTQTVNIGSIRHPVVIQRSVYEKARKLPTVQRFVLALVDGVFTSDELAKSSVLGGILKYRGVEISKQPLCKFKLTAIYKQASLLFDICEDKIMQDRGIRNAINGKCRQKKVLGRM